MLEVREGTLSGGLPYFAFGEGPPLVVFRGLGPTNTNPAASQAWAKSAFSLKNPKPG